MPSTIPPAMKRPRRRAPRRLLALPLVLAAAACSTPETGFVEQAWSPLGAPWIPFSGTRALIANDSLTAQRVRGDVPDFEPLRPEDGNVWPSPEAARPALLGGPEEAMRNIPEYRPSLIQGAPPASSPVPTPGVPSPRGSGAGASALPPPPPSARVPAQPPFAPPAPPEQRREGQVVISPSGQPGIVAGQAGRVGSVTQPGQGSSAVVRDGNVETWIGPDGRVQTRVVPPR